MTEALESRGTAGGRRSRRAFDLGRVVQRTLSAIRADWAAFLCAGLIFIGIPSGIATLGEQIMNIRPGPLPLAAYLGGNLAVFFTSVMLIGVVGKRSLDRFRGAPTSLTATLATFKRTALPLLGLGVVSTLGILFGALFFVFPALVLAVWWSVSAPALVDDRLGIMESLGRSTDLTEGFRGRIFLLIVAYVLVSITLTWAVGSILDNLGSDWPRPVWIASMVIAYATIGALTDTVASVGVTALYFELSDGNGIDGAATTAAVFD